ncbi:MAG TPA: PepSY domain-containing protein, partial [Candidatus Ozemobacteraceae bacterium]|nr:PepSY domain-containing protein [Candidatus Ozemobacteraceae bacterium]
MRKFVLCCVMALAVSVPTAFAFDVSPTQTPGQKPAKMTPVQIAPEALDALLENSSVAEGASMVTFSEDGKSFSSARGTLSEPLSGDLSEAGLNYILKNATLFNVPVNKGKDLLKVVRNEEAAGASHVSYAMVLNGVPVYGALIELHIDKNRQVQLANGALPTIKEVTNQITIGRIEAIAAAKRAVGISKIRSVARAELAVKAESDNGRMVYVVKIAAAEPLGDWEVLIDAETGKEISRLNQMMFADPVTGRGDVYPFNPLVSDVSEQDLPHLTTNTLKGLYCNVVNDDGPTAVNTDNIHKYDPNDTHFDEANMYYYINQIHDFHKKLGATKMDKPLKATVHYGDKYDNAYFSPWEDAMAFGDGNRLNDLAKEETVAYHEYSHATINTIVSLTYSKESGAINEGQADYFACSLSNDT